MAHEYENWSEGAERRIGEGLEDTVMRGQSPQRRNACMKERLSASEELGNWEKWRELGEEIRQHTLTHLDDYLYQ
ncbi:hypothetical protein ACEQPO_14680 [Bacillus sp. SL00103]